MTFPAALSVHKLQETGSSRETKGPRVVPPLKKHSHVSSAVICSLVPPGQLLNRTNYNMCYHCPAVIWGEVREVRGVGVEGITGDMWGARAEVWAKCSEARIQIQAARIH